MTTCGGWDRFPPYLHTLSGRRRALPTSQWSRAVCRAALCVLDRRTVSPLTASGTFSGTCWAGAAVGGSPSAPFCRQGPAQVCQALLVRCPLGWYRGARSPAARGCDGRGVTWPGAVSQPASSNPAGSLDSEASACMLLSGLRVVQVGPVLRPGRPALGGLRAIGMLTLQFAVSPFTSRCVRSRPQCQSASAVPESSDRMMDSDGG